MLNMIRHWLQTLPAPRVWQFAGVAVAAETPEPFAREVPGSPDAFAPVRVYRRFSALMLGVGTWQEQLPNAFEQVVLTELKDLQTSWHDQQQLLPRLPQALPELLRTLRDPRATLGELVTIVGRDPALVAAVIRMVNGTYVRTARPAVRLRDAVLLMGQEGLRGLLPTVAMRPAFHVHGGRFGTLAGPHIWAHAQRCALAGMALAGGASDAGAFDHYLAGLALGASLMLVVRTLDAQHEAGASLHSAHFADAMWQESHALAVRIAGQWDLPQGTTAELQALMVSARVPGERATLWQGEYMAMVRGLGHGGHLHDDLSAMQTHLPGILPARLQRCHSELLRFDEAETLA